MGIKKTLRGYYKTQRDNKSPKKTLKDTSFKDNLSKIDKIEKIQQKDKNAKQ